MFLGEVSASTRKASGVPCTSGRWKLAGARAASRRVVLRSRLRVTTPRAWTCPKSSSEAPGCKALSTSATRSLTGLLTHSSKLTSHKRCPVRRLVMLIGLSCKALLSRRPLRVLLKNRPELAGFWAACYGGTEAPWMILDDGSRIEVTSLFQGRVACPQISLLWECVVCYDLCAGSLFLCLQLKAWLRLSLLIWTTSTASSHSKPCSTLSTNSGSSDPKLAPTLTISSRTTSTRPCVLKKKFS